MKDCSIGQNAAVRVAVVAASRLPAKFDCPVVRQNSSLLATAHDCEPGRME